MDEKQQRPPRLGPLFWVSMVLFALLVGLVVGYRTAEHLLRVENDELHYEVERLTEERDGLYQENLRLKPRPTFRESDLKYEQR